MAVVLAAACAVPCRPWPASNPTRPVSRACAQKAGHYESFYLKPAIRRSRSAPGSATRSTSGRAGAPNGSLWFTLFEAGGPRAAKVTVAAPRSGDGDWLSVGEAALGPGRAERLDRGRGEWSLRFESGEPPLLHLPRDWMYRAPPAAHEAARAAPRSALRRHAHGGRPRGRGRRLARDGGPQLGCPARRALDLAARHHRRRRLARRRPRAHQAGAGDHALDRERRAQRRRRTPRARRSATPGGGRRVARTAARSCCPARGCGYAARCRRPGSASWAGSTPIRTEASTTRSTARSPT